MSRELQNKYKHLKLSESALDQQLKSEQARVNDLQAAADTSKAEMTDKIGLIQSLEAENTKLKQELSTKEESIQELTEKNKDLEDQTACLRAELVSFYPSKSPLT